MQSEIFRSNPVMDLRPIQCAVERVVVYCGKLLPFKKETEVSSNAFPECACVIFCT